MANYEVIGWPLPTLALASEKMLGLVDSLSRGPHLDFSVEVHFTDLNCLKNFAEVAPSSKYSLFCWRMLNDAEDLKFNEFESLGEARLVFQNTEVSISKSPFPIDDWDGTTGRTVDAILTEQGNNDRSENVRDRSTATIETLSSVLSELSAEIPEIHVCDLGSNPWKRSFSSTIEVQNIAKFLHRVCLRFQLTGGVGSFEFLGTAESIRTLVDTGRYSLSDYPASCWSMNAGTGGAPFALGPRSFLNPSPNTSRDQLAKVSAKIDTMGSSVKHCSIVRNYVSWLLPDGKGSPRLQGNYILITKQKIGYSLFVGFDRCADQDPPVKRYSLAFASALKEQGVKLKSVSCIH